MKQSIKKAIDVCDLLEDLRSKEIGPVYVFAANGPDALRLTTKELRDVCKRADAADEILRALKSAHAALKYHPEGDSRSKDDIKAAEDVIEKLSGIKFE